MQTSIYGVELNIIMEKGEKINVLQDTKIDDSDLNAEFTRQPGLFAFYAALANSALDDYNAAKREYKLLEAQVEREIRARYSLTKGPTQRAIEVELILDSRIEAKTKDLMEKESRARTMESAVDAMKQKKEMLQALGALKRAEMGGLGSSLRLDGDGSNGMRHYESQIRHQSEQSFEETRNFLGTKHF